MFEVKDKIIVEKVIQVDMNTMTNLMSMMCRKGICPMLGEGCVCPIPKANLQIINEDGDGQCFAEPEMWEEYFNGKCD